MKKIIRWAKEHREISLYIFFGGLTTVVSFVSYFVFREIFPDENSVPGFLKWTFNLASFLGTESGTVLPTVLSWVCSVTFAYITNRIWVFESRCRGFLQILAEAASFYGGRVFTLVLEILIMYLCVDLPGIHNKLYELAVKLGANVVVLVLNYVLSKLFVFRMKKLK